MIRFRLPWCLARLRAEWRHTPSRLTTARLDAHRAWDEYHLMKAERDQARARIAAVRDLHRNAYATVSDGSPPSCAAGCGTWPCPTVRAIGTGHKETETS